MKLNKTQIIVLISIALLSTLLYFLPKKVLTNTKEGANRDKPQTENPPANNPESLKTMDVILTESLSELAEAEKKDLDVDENSDLTKLIRALERFTKLDNKLGIAVCTEKMHLLFSEKETGKDYTQKEIGMAYYAAFQQSQIEENKSAIAIKATSFLKAYLEKEPGDLKIKCALADCYVNSGGPPMTGVNLLRDVIVADSTNETALLLLGQFSIKSGQTDKAIGRFESLVRHYPANIKYSLYLAQLFSDRGERDKAIETLTRAKKYAVRKSAKDSLDYSIHQLK